MSQVRYNNYEGNKIMFVIKDDKIDSIITKNKCEIDD